MSQSLVHAAPQADNFYAPYKHTLSWGSVAAAATTWINPVSGAAIGAYVLTSLATRVALNTWETEHRVALDKVAKCALAFFAFTACAVGVYSALGEAYAPTPLLAGIMTAMASMVTLWEIRSSINRQIIAAPAAQPDKAFRPYRLLIALGIIKTAVLTLIDPTLGAGMGAYFVTSVSTSAALDTWGIGLGGTLGKVTRYVLPFFAGAATSVGIRSALGVSFTLSPPFVGIFLAITALQILRGISSSTPQIQLS